MNRAVDKALKTSAAEKLFYELKPFLCVIVAVVALIVPNPPPTLIVLAMTLIACGAWILRARWKTRGRNSPLESAFYEAQPYFYILLAVGCVFIRRGEKLAMGFSIILLFCAAMILKWRKEHRS